MADDIELSGDDKAYFESRGEKLPEQKPAAAAPEEAETEIEALEDDKPDDKVEKVVPLRALTQSREEIKKEKAARADLEKRLAVLDDRWNTLLKVSEQQPDPAPVDEDPEPDPDKDIFAHNKWMRRQLDKVNGTITARDQQAAQQKQAAEFDNGVWSHWNEVALAEKAENPEFDGAVKFLSDMRTKQLKSLAGLQPSLRTEAGIVQQINSELRDIIINAANNKENAAKFVYNMAKEWGYQGKAPDPNQDPAAKGIEKLSKDIEAETSLSSAGGSRPGTGQTAKDIADMSPEAFEAWLGKHGSSGFKKLMQRGSA
jgi:hypothetical protein